MTTSRRLSAYLAAFVVGYGAPLVAIAAVQNGFTTDTRAFPSSSRMLAYEMDATQQELEELRARLWALTEVGDASNCHGEDAAASCAGIVVFDHSQ